MDHLKFSNRFTYPKLYNYEGLLGKIPVANGSFYLGLEVETEGTSHRLGEIIIPGSFKPVEDGSLKAHGMEFVTVPIRFKYVEMELRRLFGAIPFATFSPRTSIHVHMNARDFTDDELVKFLLLYLVFERNLYKFSGDRWHNNFCIPLHMNPAGAANALHKTLAGSLGNGFGWCKYYGLNLLPLIGEQGSSERIGTIEFRHMTGNKEVEWIMNWCNLILSLKIAAKRMPLSSIRIAIGNSETASPNFVEEVFKQWTHGILSNHESMDMIMESTFATKCIMQAVGLLNADKRTGL